jgi:hypothetical protein
MVTLITLRVLTAIRMLLSPLKLLFKISHKMGYPRPTSQADVCGLNSDRVAAKCRNTICANGREMNLANL